LTASREVVAVVGLGYVGLPTAACFASRGFRAIGIDTDGKKVRALKSGKPQLCDRGFPELFKRGIEEGSLSFTSDYESALADAATVFITVGTPSLRDGSIDLSQVRAAAASIGRVLRNQKGYRLVVVKSTVTPGTTRDVVGPTIEKHSGKRLGEYGLATNPEFLREGDAVGGTLSPDRVVIGADDRESKSRLKTLYNEFYAGHLPRMLLTNTVNAEIIKYASNAFLATKVSFINEVARLCSAIPGADVSVVSEGMGLDSRIGPRHLRAGLGFGGSCFPKDVRAIIAAARASGVQLPIIEAANQTNERQPLVAVQMARRMIGELRGKRVALLGLSFKPDTDDMREAVSIRLVNELRKQGSRVVVYDPVATPNARRIFGRKVEYAESVESCVKDADCCIVATEWDEFRRLRPKDFSPMRIKALVDGRRIFNPFRFNKKMKFAAVGYGKNP
jgi:UDPglucose 6-dehydrogenase